MNRGAQTLGRILGDKRGAQSAMAAELDMDQGYLSRIVSGDRVPGLGARRKFFDRYGIDLGAWDEPPVEQTAATSSPAEGAA